MRLLAIQILGSLTASDLARSFLQMLQSDPDMEVRAAAATAPGPLRIPGEIETIPEKLNQPDRAGFAGRHSRPGCGTRAAHGV